ncbi:hypothetical protein [Mycoplasma leonicaptivi]|uniref:hypothetical protein n=1 Tax=Mycoplasma leonicaptivi TaxID=36742 RepID=UPI00048614A2|nr:hypothetical protein [Mycoplasma leonicaptivi]
MKRKINKINILWKLSFLSFSSALISTSCTTINPKTNKIHYVNEDNTNTNNNEFTSLLKSFELADSNDKIEIINISKNTILDISILEKYKNKNITVNGNNKTIKLLNTKNSELPKNIKFIDTNFLIEKNIELNFNNENNNFFKSSNLIFENNSILKINNDLSDNIYFNSLQNNPNIELTKGKSIILGNQTESIKLKILDKNFNIKTKNDLVIIEKISKDNVFVNLTLSSDYRYNLVFIKNENNKIFSTKILYKYDQLKLIIENKDQIKKTYNLNDVLDSQNIVLKIEDKENNFSENVVLQQNDIKKWNIQYLVNNKVVELNHRFTKLDVTNDNKQIKLGFITNLKNENVSIQHIDDLVKKGDFLVIKINSQETNNPSNKNNQNLNDQTASNNQHSTSIPKETNVKENEQNNTQPSNQPNSDSGENFTNSNSNSSNNSTNNQIASQNPQDNNSNTDTTINSDQPVDNTVDNNDKKQEPVLSQNNRIIYVENIAGKSYGGNGTENNPYKNIQEAINNSSDGDIVKLKNSIVLQTDSHNNSYIFNKKITIDGNGHTFNIRGNNLVLTKDLIFKNASLTFTAENGNSNIYLSGNSLTLNNVSTLLSNNQANERPNIYFDSFNNSIVGNKPELIVLGDNNQTKFKSINTNLNNSQNTLKILISNPHTEVFETVNLGQYNGLVHFESNSSKVKNITGADNKQITIKLYSKNSEPMSFSNFIIPSGVKHLILENVVLRLSSNYPYFKGLGENSNLEMDSKSKLEVNNFESDYEDTFNLTFNEILGNGILQVPPKNTIKLSRISQNLNIHIFNTNEDPKQNEVLIESKENIDDNIRINLTYNQTLINALKLTKVNNTFKYTK